MSPWLSLNIPKAHHFHEAMENGVRKRRKNATMIMMRYEVNLCSVAF